MVWCGECGELWLRLLDGLTLSSIVSRLISSYFFPLVLCFDWLCLGPLRRCLVCDGVGIEEFVVVSAFYWFTLASILFGWILFEFLLLSYVWLLASISLLSVCLLCDGVGCGRRVIVFAIDGLTLAWSFCSCFSRIRFLLFCFLFCAKLSCFHHYWIIFSSSLAFAAILLYLVSVESVLQKKNIDGFWDLLFFCFLSLIDWLIDWLLPVTSKTKIYISTSTYSFFVTKHTETTDRTSARKLDVQR